jgi:bacillolysin
MKREEKAQRNTWIRIARQKYSLRNTLAFVMTALLLLNGGGNVLMAATAAPSMAFRQAAEVKSPRMQKRHAHLQLLRQAGGPANALNRSSLVPVQMTLDSQKGLPRFILGKFPVDGGLTPEKAAIHFLSEIKEVFMMADPEQELSMLRTDRDPMGMTHVRFRQEYRGLRVYGSEMVVHFDSAGNIRSINGDYLPDLSMDTTPAISGEQAQAIALSDMSDAAARLTSQELLVFNRLLLGGQDDRDSLAWKTVIAASASADEWVYFIDAHDGRILLRYNNLKDALSRETYTANNAENLPGRLLMREGQVSTDQAAQSAHKNAGTAYNYFRNTFGRDSFDGNGAKIISSVHYQRDLVNAYWNGTQLVFGDGDGIKTRPLSMGLDVVAHELTHAVTQYSADLEYYGQSGALNESFSDIFSAMVDRDDWLLGEEVFLPASTRKATRSMADPTLYNQPDHMSRFVETQEDNGGVHINSGIPNKICYLISDGGTHYGTTVSGIGRAASEKIFYRALTSYLTSQSDFSDARNAAVLSAADLFGEGSNEQKTVADAFTAAGIGEDDSDGGTQDQWTIIAVSADTPHPYPNNYVTNHYYSKPGAGKVAVHFSAFDLEEDYDYMLVFDRTGKMVDAYTGTQKPFWVVVEGDYIKVMLVSDAWISGYGYHIDAVAYTK